MNALKKGRTLAASLAVLATTALAASPAMAFDNLRWNWSNDVNSDTDVDVYVDVDVASTGLVQLEKLQIFLGNVSASSKVTDITNDPIRPTSCGSYCGPSGHDSYGGHHQPPRPQFRPLDARTELPIILSSATAVGNNQSITTDTPVFLHDGQFVANVRDGNCGGGCGDGFDVAAFQAGMPTSGPQGGHGYGPSGNLNTQIAGLFTFGAAIGALTKANIEAESIVKNVTNVSVDSSATAVANNLSLTLASDVDGGTSCRTGCGDRLSNHVVIGDITQFALANVSATSRVSDVTASGYDHMRELTTASLQPVEGNLSNTVAVPTPWISSVATAIGNNVSVNVGRDLTTPSAP